MKYELDAFIFDFDGVIIDSGSDIINAVQYTLKYFDRPELPRDEIISYVGHGVEWLIKHSFKDCHDEIVRKAIPIYRNYYFENVVVETKTYKYVEETLKHIKRNIKNTQIALVTNKPEDLTKKILTELKINEYFDMVVGPESVSRLKPDPEGINQVLHKFSTPACKAIMIGDTFIDIEAGKNAGTITCGVTYGLGNTEALIKSSPDLLIDDIYKLIDFIA